MGDDFLRSISQGLEFETVICGIQEELLKENEEKRIGQRGKWPEEGYVASDPSGMSEAGMTLQRLPKLRQVPDYL